MMLITYIKKCTPVWPSWVQVPATKPGDKPEASTSLETPWNLVYMPIQAFEI
jgi:hypothetical protein